MKSMSRLYEIYYTRNSPLYRSGRTQSRYRVKDQVLHSDVLSVDFQKDGVRQGRRLQIELHGIDCAQTQ